MPRNAEPLFPYAALYVESRPGEISASTEMNLWVRDFLSSSDAIGGIRGAALPLLSPLTRWPARISHHRRQSAENAPALLAIDC